MRRRRSIRLREARAQKPLESRAGAESTRLVVLVPKITVLRAWDTQGLFARSRLRRMLRPRPHQRCPRQAHRHRRPRHATPPRARIVNVIAATIVLITM